MANELSEAQARHLRELVKAPFWTPSNAGEWSVARALERRGFLSQDPSRGRKRYALTDEGLRAARREELAARREELVEVIARAMGFDSMGADAWEDADYKAGWERAASVALDVLPFYGDQDTSKGGARTRVEHMQAELDGMKSLLVQAIKELQLTDGEDRADAHRLDRVDDFVAAARAALSEARR